MHRAILRAGAISLVALTAPAVFAQSDSTRYTMAPTDDGFVRLDTVTGAMSLCSKGDAGWSCKPMENSGKDPQSDIDKLKSENAELRAELRRLEDEFIDGKRGLSGAPKPEFQLPSEEEVDQAVDYLEGMIKKFRERFEHFGDKTQPDHRPPNSTPDTTPSPDSTPAPTPNSLPGAKPGGTPL
ncbi:hypothetical protein [Filomicrobium sp.]|uniref:hypothetical protein n=1 Tax=Filomicrobium sp. TaxID=2024831 RepID=UPI002587E37A|nr:hypothetical protein [Filomicrobium sp.]MCV0367824.1 hypothetical protein [Filomicrobium sp.]